MAWILCPPKMASLMEAKDCSGMGGFMIICGLVALGQKFLKTMPDAWQNPVQNLSGTGGKCF